MYKGGSVQNRSDQTENKTDILQSTHIYSDLVVVMAYLQYSNLIIFF
jgi:hypothetical protein